MKRTTTEIGRIGESAVCRHLTQQGYTIRKRNYRIRGGEIDIIAQKGEILAFVEVKTQYVRETVSPLERLLPQQQARIIRTAMVYCAEQNPDWTWQPRYDAAAVIIDREEIVSLEYVENAFDASGLDVII